MSSSFFAKISLTLIVLGTQYGLWAKAYASGTFSEPIGNDYFERNSESVPIAGAFITGVVAVAEIPSTEKPEITAYIPEKWAEDIVCVRGHSVDGRYESSRNHKIPEKWQQSEHIEFLYPTKTDESRLLVEQAKVDHFGMTISVGECGLDGNEFVPVYLNGVPDVTTKQVTISINSVGADKVRAYVGEAADAPAINCNKIQSLNTKGFDFHCEIPAEQFSPGKKNSIEINTESDGLLDAPIQIEVFFPAP